MQLSIAQLTREISKLKSEAASDRRQADRFEAQAAYGESTDPASAHVNHEISNKFERTASDREQQIADYESQITTLRQRVSELESELAKLDARRTEVEREIVNLKG